MTSTPALATSMANRQSTDKGTAIPALTRMKTSAEWTRESLSLPILASFRQAAVEAAALLDLFIPGHQSHTNFISPSFHVSPCTLCQAVDASSFESATHTDSSS